MIAITALALVTASGRTWAQPQGPAPASSPDAPAAQPAPEPVVGIAGPGDRPAKAAAPLSTQLGVALPAPMPSLRVPDLNLAPILAEDAASDGALREGVSVPVEFNPAMGDMLNVPGGGWLWVLDVTAPGAFGVRIHFSDFNLPPGARAIVYDPRIPGNLPSPYSGRGVLATGEFWAWTSWSDTARVEVYFPPELGDNRFNQVFTIDQVVRMYRDPLTGRPDSGGLRVLPCHNDLECFPNWIQVGASVGRMSFILNGSSFVCSGAMLNNTSFDLTPYFMTAHHCMQDNTGALSSLNIYWFYERIGCNGAIPAFGNLPRSDVASYVRSNLATDMSLVMIEGTVPRTLWWAGNTGASQAIGTQVVGIHHPGGTEKRISFGTYDYPLGCGATGLQNGFQVQYYSGTVEPGSSGSPLFLTNGLFMGVDSCGPTGGQCPGDGHEGVYGDYFVGFGAFNGYFTNPGPDDSYENNDACGSATNLNIYYNGTLSPLTVRYGHDDWYHVTVPAFGDASFHIHFTHAWGDTDIALFDGCGGPQLGISEGITDDESISWHNSSVVAHEVYLHVYLYTDTRNYYYLDFARYSPQVPGNDACANAIPLTLGTNALGQTNGATVDGSASCAATGAAPDVWYRVSSPCGGVVALNTEGSDFDTVLSVHSSCPGTPANQVACNDDDNDSVRWSSLTFIAAAGQNYYVRISGYSGAFGHYTLHSAVAHPTNDDCANAIPLTAGSYGFNSCNCTTDGPPDDVCMAFSSNQIYNDFWNTFTPSCYGTVEVNTFGSSFDTKLAVYPDTTGTTCPPGPNSAIACNDDSNGTLQSRVTFSCVANQRYIIRTGAYSQTGGGAGTLTILYTPSNPCIPPPPCRPDADHDGQITPADIATFVNTWYTSLQQGTLDGDYDGDGFVQPADIAAFVNAWFTALSSGC